MKETKEKTSLRISVEKWSLLSKQEKELAKQLGFKPPAIDQKRLKGEQEEKEKRVAPLKPYVLGYIETCKLCGSVHIKLYKMEPAKKGEIPYLVSCELTENGHEVKPDKWGARASLFCSACPSMLRLLTKDELITKLIACVSFLGKKN